MIDTIVLLTPIIMIGVVSLVVFVGCDQVFDLDRVEPDIPVLTAKAGDMRVDLEWRDNPNASKFDVKRGLMPGTHEFLAEVQGGTYAYADLNVDNGTPYYYVVSAFGGEEGETDDSNEEPAIPGAAASTEFLKVDMKGTLATAAGLYGMVVRVGPANLKITELGRIAAVGMSTGTHVLKVVDAATMADFGNPVAVSMTGTDVDKYAYAAIPDSTPIILLANATYYFVTAETNPGDQFLNHNTKVKTSTDATVTGAVNKTTGSYVMDATGQLSYGVVNFKYQIQ